MWFTEPSRSPGLCARVEPVAVIGRYRLNVGGLRGGLPGEEPKYIVFEPRS